MFDSKSAKKCEELYSTGDIIKVVGYPLCDYYESRNICMLVIRPNEIKKIGTILLKDDSVILS